MTRYLLDTSALLTLRDNESGAEQVAEILYQAQQTKAQCFGSFMSLMEVFYRVWKDETSKKADWLISNAYHCRLNGFMNIGPCWKRRWN